MLYCIVADHAAEHNCPTLRAPVCLFHCINASDLVEQSFWLIFCVGLSSANLKWTTSVQMSKIEIIFQIMLCAKHKNLHDAIKTGLVSTTGLKLCMGENEQFTTGFPQEPSGGHGHKCLDPKTWHLTWLSPFIATLPFGLFEILVDMPTEATIFHICDPLLKTKRQMTLTWSQNDKKISNCAINSADQTVISMCWMKCCASTSTSKTGLLQTNASCTGQFFQTVFFTVRCSFAEAVADFWTWSTVGNIESFLIYCCSFYQCVTTCLIWISRVPATLYLLRNFIAYLCLAKFYYSYKYRGLAMKSRLLFWLRAISCTCMKPSTCSLSMTSG